MTPLVIAAAALLFALGSLCLTLWGLRHMTKDTDVEELADEVAKLARRARADTMRRVRAETRADSSDAPPPELQAPAPQPLGETKEQLRARLARAGTIPESIRRH